MHWRKKPGAGRSLAIVIQNQVYSVTMVREAMNHGKCLLSGDFRKSDLEWIRSLLKPYIE